MQRRFANIPVEVWVFITTAVIMLWRLGSYPLFPEWEAHYSTVVRHMAERGDWFDPVYLGRPFLDKPILLFLLQLMSVQLLGLTELALRLPGALIVVGGTVAFTTLVKRIYGQQEALMAGLMLATTPAYYLLGRSVTFDGSYAALQSVALLCLALGAIPRGPAEQEPPEPRRRLYLLFFWLLTGLAILTKGLLAVALPGAVGLAYLLLTRDVAIIKRLEPWWGLPLMFLVAAPWFAFMVHRHGESFLSVFFLDHHVGRMAGRLSNMPGGTFVFYLEKLAVGTMPWLILVPLGLVHALNSPRQGLNQTHWRETFLRLAFFAPCVFFTMSQVKFAHYILPAIPFLVLLTARALAEELREPRLSTSPILWLTSTLAFAAVANEILVRRGFRLLVYFFCSRRLVESMDVNPRQYLVGVFVVATVTVLFAMVQRRMTADTFWTVFAAAVASAVIWLNVVVPPLGHMYSSRILIDAYNRVSDVGDPFLEFRTWKDRANVFYLPADRTAHWVGSVESLRNMARRYPGQPLHGVVAQGEYDRYEQHAREAGFGMTIVGNDQYRGYSGVNVVRLEPHSPTRPRTGEDSSP
jgi:4-amino-4-deoxy-L-arabinose transferase-like glycosyltransferase